MLESVLADVLTRVLGQYLKGIDHKSVRFGAWSGLVELRGVALRPEALAVLFETLGMDLPVTVKAGFIGLLRLQVPWKSIGTTPVQIHMEDVTIIACPVRGDGSDHSELENRERRIKCARLNTDDAIREASWGVSSYTNSTASSSWSTWLVSEQLRAAIIDNIQIHLKDIILRFEDPFSDPRKPYMASISCDSLKAISVNENWKEAFVKRGDDKVTRKLLEVKGFRIDWAPIVASDSRSESLGTASSPSSSDEQFETAERLKQFVTQSSVSNANPHTNAKSLLHSVDGFMRLKLSPTQHSAAIVDFQLQEPSVDLDIRFPDVTIDLDDVQYAGLLQTSVYFARLATRGTKPTTPKDRWKWAVDQLLPGFHGRRKRALRFTEKGILETRDTRLIYSAYRRSILKARRSGIEEPVEVGKQMEAIEDSLSFEEIAAYRDSIDRQIELEGVSWLQPSKKPEEIVSGNQGTTSSSFWSMLGYTDQAASSDDVKDVKDKASPVEEKPEAITIPTSAASSSELVSSKPFLSLRTAFLLEGATVNLSEDGFPNISIPRVALNLQRLQIGILYSSAKDLIFEAVLGSIEAWDVMSKTKMVYNRLPSVDMSLRREDSLLSSGTCYPKNVLEAIQSIRSGSNPAKDFLIEDAVSSDDDANGEECSEKLEEGGEGDEHRNSSSGESSKKRSKSHSRARGGSSAASFATSFRVTEAEFLGNPKDLSGVGKYICAFRYSQMAASQEGEFPIHFRSSLDVSVATLEAVVDGPKGSFLWGLKFWQPKGMVQDPIMGFLGAAAGARIAELRIELEEALIANRVPLEINAVIMAPRFIIPSFDREAPAIVINMGTLGICTSDNSPNLEPASVSSKKPVRYSNYVLTLDDLGMYYSPDLKTAVSRNLHVSENNNEVFWSALRLGQMNLDTTNVERIIRPFCLRFILQTLRDSKVVQVVHAPKMKTENLPEGIAKVRVRGNIPGLSVIVTKNTFQHLLVAAQIWASELRSQQPGGSRKGDTEGWKNVFTEHAELEGPQLSQRLSQAQYPSSKSTQTSSSPPTIASYDVKVLVHRVSVEIRQTAKQRLVTAVASRMQANVIKTGKTNLTAEFTLKSWSVTDGTRGSTAAFRRLVYAGTFSDGTCISPPRSLREESDAQRAEWDGEKNFVTIRYEFDLVSSEQKFVLQFLSLNMVFVRETYIRLAFFFDAVRKYVKDQLRSRSQRVQDSQEQLFEDGTNLQRIFSVDLSDRDVRLPTINSKISVVSEFDGFRFQLIASGGAIAAVEMRDSNIHFRKEKASRGEVWGGFRYFSVRDLTAPMAEHMSVLKYEKPSSAVHRMIEDSELGEEDNATKDEWRITLPKSGSTTMELVADFGGIDILYLARFSEVLRHYILALLDGLRPVLQTTHREEDGLNELDLAQTPLVTGISVSFGFRSRLQLSNLTIRVPRHSLCSSEALNILVPRIGVTTVIDSTGLIESESQVDGVQLETEYLLPKENQGQSASVSSTFLKDLTASISLQRDSNQSSFVSEGASQPIKGIKVHIAHPLRMNLCEAQYTILYFVLTENLMETISGDDVGTSLGPDDITDGIEGSHETRPQEERNILRGNVQGDEQQLSETVITDSPVLEFQKSRFTSVEVSVPFVSIEVSRGWDVGQQACKVIGLYVADVSIDMKRFVPYRLLVELEGKLVRISDLRSEAGIASRTVAVPLHPAGKDGEDLGQDKADSLSMTYDKQGSAKPSIVVFISNIQLEMNLGLFLDLPHLAVPGWPFLSSSRFPPDFEYLGRTMNVVLSGSQVVFFAQEHDKDRRAIVFTGEFMLKMDWMRVTGAKRASLRSTQLEVAAVPMVPELEELREFYGSKRYLAETIAQSGTALVYPTDSFLEYVGPDVDDAGRRIDLSVDAVLCAVSASELPLLRAILKRGSCAEQTTLIRRDWIQPSVDIEDMDSNGKDIDEKESQRQKAMDSMNFSATVPAVRCLITDDRGGRFVPILETRISSFKAQAHGSDMVQVEGEISMDLFNSDKGWWEPAVEPWHVAASMSRGQSGTQAFVVRSEVCLNINFTPTTVTACGAVTKAVKNAIKKKQSENMVSAAPSPGPKLGSQPADRRPSIAAFLVRNELGIPISMTLPSSSRKTIIQNETEIEVGAQSESLLSAAPVPRANERSRESALRCSIGIPLYNNQDVSAAEMGIRNIVFYPTSHSSQRVYALWEVRMNKGVPLCILRSFLRIKNDTRSTLELMVSGQEGLSPSEVDSETDLRVLQKSLEPGEHYSVPVAAIEDLITVRPCLSTGLGSSPFDWSTQLPDILWMQRAALEHVRRKQRDKSGAYKTGMRFQESQETLVCKSRIEDACDFFLKIVPSTPISNEQSLLEDLYLDVILRAPIVLENNLPGLLSYRIFVGSSPQMHRFGDGSVPDGAILAAGLIDPLGEAHVHISRESSESTFLSLAYDNSPSSADADSDISKKHVPDQFGAGISLLDLETGRVKGAFLCPERTEVSKGNTRKQFRASVLQSKKDPARVQIYSGFLVRNRSDTALEICSRSSFYGTGSMVSHLRERPPLEKPDRFVCCEGPYLSIRFPRNNNRNQSDRINLDYSNWWTTPAILDDIEKPMAISLPERSLELEVRPLSELECASSVITIRNSSWIMNSTSSALQWCQESSLDSHGNCPTRMVNTIQPGQASGVHWYGKASQRALHLRLTDESGFSDWIWSPAIPLDIGFSRELPAKMYRPKSHEQYIARVASKETGGNSRVLVVHPEDRPNPPYRIVNLCTERAVAFAQVGSTERPWLVRAGKSSRYSWDDPLAPPGQRRLAIRIVEKAELSSRGGSSAQGGLSETRSTPHPSSAIRIDAVGDRVMVLSEGYNPAVVIAVSVDRATKIVTFYDEGDDSKPLLGLKRRFSKGLSTSEGDTGAAVPMVAWDDIKQISDNQPDPRPDSSDVKLQYDYACREIGEKMSGWGSSEKVDRDAAIFLQSVGISVVDAEPCELLYTRIDEILFNFESYEATQSVGLYVKRFQVDNQLFKTSYPVLFWTAPHQSGLPSAHTSHQDQLRENSAIALEIHRDVTNEDIIMIKSFHASAQPSSLFFDDSLVTRVLTFLSDSQLVRAGNRFEPFMTEDEDRRVFMNILSKSNYQGSGPSTEKKNRVKSTATSSGRIYLHSFVISSTGLRLTSAGSGAAIAKAAGLSSSARTLVGLVLNVENCDFAFSALDVKNVFDSVHHFAVLVREYYVSQLNNQRMKLLASNSLVGNPAALFDAVGTGARDFITESTRGKGSGGFIANVANVGKGSKSLFSHTVGGLVESVTSIPRAVSSGLEKAVGDNDYLAERRRIRGSNLGTGRGSAAKNPAQGLATGALSFAHGISSGVHGFIREPVQGAKQGGAGGLLKGIGRAFIGGVAKPVAGVIDLVAEPVAGLSRQIAGSEGHRHTYIPVPERPPRGFRGRNARLDSYNPRYAVGVCIFNAVQAASGLAYSGHLIDWVELSGRAARTEAGSEQWVWEIVQRYSRSMPGAEKQLRAEERRIRQDLMIRPEKVRVALLTETYIVVATLDCKLVSSIALWKEAAYDIVGEGKEIILTTTMPRNASESDREGSGLLQGAQALISAPWDAPVAGKRKKPTPGSYVVDRIPCGSFEARAELRDRLTTLLTNFADGKTPVTNRDLSAPGESGTELSVLGHRGADNEKEMQLTGSKATTSANNFDQPMCNTSSEGNAHAHRSSALRLEEQRASSSQQAGPSGGHQEDKSEDEKLVQQLVDIGFKFEDAVSALAEASGDLVKAVDILTR